MTTAFDPEAFGLETGSVSIPDMDGNDFAVGFLAAGDATAPLALCLHGYPDSAWTWRHLLPRLAEAGFRAVAPFDRGYAPTEMPSDGLYQAGVLGVDANHLHDALGGDGHAVVIGHDWGAMGAYSAAVLDPDRWSRVVASAVMPGPVAAAAFLSYDQLKLSWYMFFQMTGMADGFIPMNDHEFISRLWGDWSPGYEATTDVAAFVECMQTAENLSAALSYYRHTLTPELQDPRLGDAQGAVFTIPSQPLLYMHGTQDGCMSPEMAATVGAFLTVEGSEAIMVPGTGHFLHLEKPDEVNDHIIGFLTKE